MLPVQTVMIRYMVLVYRWGRGWLGVVGGCGGSVGGAVTGGCARHRGCGSRARVRKGPADEGWRGRKVKGRLYSFYKKLYIAY